MSRIEQDEFAHSVYETGLPTHTDPKEIAAWLAVPSDNPKIVFTTYHSSDQLAAGARLAGVEFDLALLDEAHKTVGNRSKTYATLLSDEKIKIRRRMFMTATERVFRGDNDDVLCMDREADYGKCFFRMSFKDAIAEDIITDYKIVTVTVSQQHVRQLIADNRILNLSDDLDEAEAQRLATGITVKNAFRDYGIKHGIGFCRSIKAADQLRGQQVLLNDVSGLGPEIENFQISSKKSQGQRSDTLKQFRAAERGFITNARYLTEGVDVPAIDCVAFADPKQSTIDIVQAAGRALRKFEDKITGYTKTCGYILLPIVVPDGMDFVEFAETTAFRNIVRTIAALSTQDERIAEQFRAVENGHVSKGKIVEITGDVPVGMRMDLKEFTDAISTRIWESVGRVSWRPFEEARESVWGLGFKLQSEYRAYYKSGNKPADIPSAPDKIYANRGWINWGDWLGTSKPWRLFEDARTLAHGLKLDSSQEWFAYCRSSKKPADIPVHPERAYADCGWTSWGDFLGNGNVTNISWRPFEGSRAFVHALEFKSQKEYGAYCRSGNKPADIPSTPRTTYADSGWIGWGDWLGTGNVLSKSWRPFEEGRAFARGLKFKSRSEWEAHCRSGNKPADIPSNPQTNYADSGWIGWGDFLGNGNVTNISWRPFEEARQFAHGLKLNSAKEYGAYCKSGNRPDDIPSAPDVVYADSGWVGWGDWLGTGNVLSKSWRPFEEARSFVHGLKLKSTTEYRAYCKSGNKPDDIPTHPHIIYADSGWISWYDWLGNDNPRLPRKIRASLREGPLA